MTRKTYTYIPSVSDDYAEKLREWQNKVYDESKQRDTQNIKFLGRNLIIPPRVHPINAMSDLLGNAVLNEVNENDRVLDMGTGSGVNAILVASKAKIVVAVDINPEAIQSAVENAKVNGVSLRISFGLSDEGYKSLTTFFSKVNHYLNNKG